MEIENKCCLGISEHCRITTWLHAELLDNFIQESEILHIKKKKIRIAVCEKQFVIVQNILKCHNHPNNLSCLSHCF